MMSVLVRPNIVDEHEKAVRRIFAEQFDIVIPTDLVTPMKVDIQKELFVQNLKSVTAKLPNSGAYSTMVFDQNKQFVYGFITNIDSDDNVTVLEFNREEGDNLATRIGEEVFSNAKSFN